MKTIILIIVALMLYSCSSVPITPETRGPSMFSIEEEKKYNEDIDQAWKLFDTGDWKAAKELLAFIPRTSHAWTGEVAGLWDNINRKINEDAKTTVDYEKSKKVSVKTYHIGDTTIVEGLQVKLRSAEFVSSFTNWVRQTTYGASPFLIVNVVCINLVGEPLPMHFQPVFNLLDSNGSKYAPSQHHTVMINLNKPGRPRPGETWNPNIEINQEIVFEVPINKNYTLQVIAPSRAQVGFAGSINVSGQYVLFDLSPNAVNIK